MKTSRWQSIWGGALVLWCWVGVAQAQTNPVALAGALQLLLGDDPANHTPPTITTVVAFGDSITYGSETSSGGPSTAYPHYLQDLLQNRVTLINAGLGGERLVGGNARLGSVLDTYHPDVVLIMEGVNDLWWAGTSSATMELYLRSMIRQAQDRHIAVVLATLTPATTSTLNSKFNLFNEVYIRPLAQELGLPLADIYTGIVSQSNWRNTLMNNWPASAGLPQGDPVHPNNAGEYVMAEVFAQVLSDNFTWVGR